MPGGRPKRFQSVEQLEELLEEYREIRRSKELPMTMSSLAAHLKCTRGTLWQYENEEQYKEFSNTIKVMKQEVEADLSDDLLTRKSQAGHIFVLKSMHGLSETDKREVVNKNFNTEISTDKLETLSTEDLEKLKELHDKLNN